MDGASPANRADVVVVGAGHNALVAAALLARAGLSVTVLERRDHVGGTAVSSRPFPGVDASLSSYAYLVSLFPRALFDQLGVDVELRARRPSACAPDGGAALVVDPDDGESTRRSFETMGIGDEYHNLARWQALVGRMASTVAPTFLEPLRAAAWFRRALGPEIWELFVQSPLGTTINGSFSTDLVRGMVLTDGLIGTFARSDDDSLRQNVCFLYHVVGDGTGKWQVPVGGMGALTAALHRAAHDAGARIHTGTEVASVSADGRGAEVATSDGTRISAHVVLCCAAPAEAERLLGVTVSPSHPEGAQVKVNMVLDHLPALRAGVDPRRAFTGTLHVNERLDQLDAAWHRAAEGALPDPVPSDVYCHSLTDPSVLGPQLRRAGAHTVSLFALQTPRRLFRSGDGQDAFRQVVLDACLDSLGSVLAEPLRDCVLAMPDGRPCIEVHTPVDLEHELRLPGGDIFHNGLNWPWAEEEEQIGRWGVETHVANVFVCGAGARRGGGVSGLGGHNAAMATLAHLRSVRP